MKTLVLLIVSVAIAFGQAGPQVRVGPPLPIAVFGPHDGIIGAWDDDPETNAFVIIAMIETQTGTIQQVFYTREMTLGFIRVPGFIRVVRATVVGVKEVSYRTEDIK